MAPAITLKTNEISEKIKAISNPIKMSIIITSPGITRVSACPNVAIEKIVPKIADPLITVARIITKEFSKNVNTVTSNPAIAPLLGEVAIKPATKPAINQAPIDNGTKDQPEPINPAK